METLEGTVVKRSAVAQRLKVLLEYHQYLIMKNNDKEEMDRVANEIYSLTTELEAMQGEVAGLFE